MTRLTPNTDLTALTVKKLRAIAKDGGVPGYYKLNKTRLIEEVTILQDVLTKSEEEKKEERTPVLNFTQVRFGKAITAEEIRGYVSELWNGVFKVTGVEYDGHYWKAEVKHEATKDTVSGVRMDYLINYFRPPRVFSRREDVKARRSELIRETAS